MGSARGWMCSTWLSLVTGCGPEVAAGAGGLDLPAPQCEAGPEIVATVETCELTVEGEGGPTAARMWTIETDDGSTVTHFARRSDGALYLFGDERPQRGLNVWVARFGPEFELEWSRRLVHIGEYPDLEYTASLGAHALDTDGAWLGTNLRSKPQYWEQRDACWLTRVDEHGSCGPPASLEFGGDTRCEISSVLREPDGLVLAGASESYRGHVERRTLAGDRLAVIEISALSVSVLAYWPERYMVRYGVETSHGPTGWITMAWILDGSLSSAQNFWLGHHLGFRHDVFGRLYSTRRGLLEPSDQPTTIEVSRLATPDEPTEVAELSVPQPQCGEITAYAVFDETLVVTYCEPLESLNTIMGYHGEGAPSWTATLSCSGSEQLGRLRQGIFSEDGRLWLTGPGLNRVIEIQL